MKKSLIGALLAFFLTSTMVLPAGAASPKAAEDASADVEVASKPVPRAKNTPTKKKTEASAKKKGGKTAGKNIKKASAKSGKKKR